MTKKIVKKVWKNFEIIKVKLNPEQAVLSCCNSSGVLPARTPAGCTVSPCSGKSAGGDSASS
ncbi:MAG: hypothetical protein NT099_04980 [Candidatus Saganbacteria bacterium]|nr:hypothetical protein [Candidatus Saganbacteria bacterium]